MPGSVHWQPRGKSLCHSSFPGFWLPLRWSRPMRLQGRYKQQREWPERQNDFSSRKSLPRQPYPHELPCEPASVVRRYLRWHKYSVHWCASGSRPQWSLFHPLKPLRFLHRFLIRSGFFPPHLGFFRRQLVFQEHFFPQNGPSTLFSELRLEWLWFPARCYRTDVKRGGERV